MRWRYVLYTFCRINPFHPIGTSLITPDSRAGSDVGERGVMAQFRARKGAGWVGNISDQ